MYVCGCKLKNINDMNKRESIKYHKQHRGKHDVGGMADYVKGGFYSPIFEGATIRTIKYGNRNKVISDLERYGEYTNRELLMQNFAIGENCSEMWVYELVDAIFDYFGEQRRMSVGDFINLCDEFSTYMGDDECYVTVTRFEDGWNITHVRYDASQPTNSATVKYVHELQHAFSLFGVDIKIRM